MDHTAVPLYLTHEPVEVIVVGSDVVVRQLVEEHFPNGQNLISPQDRNGEGGGHDGVVSDTRMSATRSQSHMSHTNMSDVDNKRRKFCS